MARPRKSVVEVQHGEPEIERPREVVQAAVLEIRKHVCPRCKIEPRIYATGKRGAFRRVYAICGTCGQLMKWDESK